MAGRIRKMNPEDDDPVVATLFLFSDIPSSPCLVILPEAEVAAHEGVVHEGAVLEGAVHLVQVEVELLDLPPKMAMKTWRVCAIDY